MGAQPELLLLHPGGGRPGPAAAHRAQEAISSAPIITCAWATFRTFKRLARFVAGNAVNIVLAGGGARGFAPHRCAESPERSRVPFDYVAGTSMGGIVPRPASPWNGIFRN